ncbi:MAG: LTA synthase family protein [Deltaproteobacteria bacterium]|nr:LTA synthase family protein [Deltaproteobacteria bacterium]
MKVEAAWLPVAAALLGLVFSAGVERFLKPRPFPRRPRGAWEAHAGLWCAGYGLIVLVLGRPGCALAAASAGLVALALVNNAKMRNLREPFIFQDHDYFPGAIRHPRLFLPFLGWKNFFMAAAFFSAAAAGLYYESPPIRRFAFNGQLGGILIVLGAAALLLRSAARRDPPVSFNPQRDVQALGLLAGAWAYHRAERHPPNLSSPFDGAGMLNPQAKPHLVAVQHESFFDPRRLYNGIRPDILAAFDAMRGASSGYGLMEAPAWGANTVRTEFAFLTGVNEEGLGVHRFNPYREILRGRRVSSLPQFLKSLGYGTIAIHPYQARYFSRDRVFRRFGFDEFLDIRSFAGARRSGPYVADAEVGEKIIRVLSQANGPTFVFAITMEGHAPFSPARMRPSDVEEFYLAPPPPGCEELTVYLRHLRNTDEMLRSLSTALTALGVPAELCCFGDHVPIMPEVYKILGAPKGDVPYLFWSGRQRPAPEFMDSAKADNQGRCQGGETRLGAHALASSWLRAAWGIRE